MKRLMLCALSFGATLAVVGCKKADTDTAPTELAKAEDASSGGVQVAAAEGEAKPAEHAVAPMTELTSTFAAKNASNLTGKVKLETIENKLKMGIELSGLMKGQKLTAMINEKADCSAEDVVSAGAAWKLPVAMNADQPVGWLGSMEVGADGMATLSATIDAVSLKAGDPASMLDRAIVIHAAAIEAGKPSTIIGCGELKAMAPKAEAIN